MCILLQYQLVSINPKDFPYLFLQLLQSVGSLCLNLYFELILICLWIIYIVDRQVYQIVSLIELFVPLETFLFVFCVSKLDIEHSLCHIL